MSGESDPERDSVERKALDAAVAKLSRKDYTRAELSAKLSKAGFAPAAVAATLDRLEGLGYVNDGRYAEAFVKFKAGARGHGEYRIRRELERRGVDEASVDAAVQTWTSENAPESGSAWLEVASRLLERKFGRHEQLEPKERNRRLQFLLRRGYTYEQAAAALAATRGPASED
jgi:regulatory protein